MGRDRGPTDFEIISTFFIARAHWLLASLHPSQRATIQAYVHFHIQMVLLMYARAGRTSRHSMPERSNRCTVKVADDSKQSLNDRMTTNVSVIFASRICCLKAMSFNRQNTTN